MREFKRYSIKCAGKSDFKALDNFYRQYSSGGLARFILKGWFTGEDPEGTTIFAVSNNTIIGAGYIRICGQKFGLFTSWLVHPDWRKRGIASAMDEFSFNLLHSKGVRNATLVVGSKNTNSLDRLYYLKSKNLINLEIFGDALLVYIYMNNNTSTFPDYDGKIFYAGIDDETGAWWFLRTSSNFYRSRQMYGENGDFHILDRIHFKNLISKKRVFIVRNKYWISGLAIINKSSIFNDRNEKPIVEIGFACGFFEPIISFLSKQNNSETAFRAYLFSKSQLKRFIKNHESNIETLKLFSYKQLNNCQSVD